MKKAIYIIFVGITFLTGTLLGSGLTTNNSVFAQETLELNIGQTARDRDLVGASEYDESDPGAGFGGLIEQVLSIVVTVAALILFLMLIWGGIEWITAGGDKGKIEKARNRITQSIIGMIVLASAIAIFAALQTALNFEVFDFGTGGGGGTQPPAGLPDCGPGVPDPCRPVPL